MKLMRKEGMRVMNQKKKKHVADVKKEEIKIENGGKS